MNIDLTLEEVEKLLRCIVCAENEDEPTDFSRKLWDKLNGLSEAEKILEDTK